MKTVSIVISKLLAKVAALFTLSVLTIFASIFKVALFLYRIVAIPFAIIGTLMAAYDFFFGTFTADSASIILFSVILVALHYTLPLLKPVLDFTNGKLQGFISAPLYMRVKPPVRYTM